jgi:fluoride exporter
MLLALCLILMGGALGSVWRFHWSGLIADRFGETFPYGTLVVNLTGSFLIGVGSALTTFGPDHQRSVITWFLLVGICGGLTTFSSYSLQTLILIFSRRWIAALLYLISSTLFCLAATAIGWMLTNWLLARVLG